MLMPSIFGENLFDDFFTPFYYDDKDEKKAEKKLYGHRAQNLLRTDIKETKEGYELVIDVPGFKTLVFRANQTSQKVNFYNPEENECLFKLKLYANDKQLWESGYIQPSDGYYDIEISDPLDVGEYDGKLIYQCYKDDGTQLNSAVVTFKLIVKEQ